MSVYWDDVEVPMFRLEGNRRSNSVACYCLR